jgi:iron complex transport system ATP-binding protein
MSFAVSNLGFAHGLEQASFTLPSHGFVALVGPNGAGKSTLVRILSGFERTYRGSCRYAGTELRAWNRKAFSQRVAFLPQSIRVDFPFTAEQIVLMGRTPFSTGLFDSWFESPEDHAATERAMRITDTLAFRDRDCRTLSGGERQRVILASALAQEPETLLLDEPATFLDLKHQVALFRLLKDLSQRMLVVTVTHDLSLTLRYADRVIGLQDGRIAADGPTSEVLAAHNIERMFGVTARIHGGGSQPQWVEYDA